MGNKKELLTAEEKKKRLQEATMKFEKNTYKKIMVRLRVDKDQELIDYLEEEKAKGIGTTEIIRDALWQRYMNK